ncbi:MAG: hypothetical protein AAFO77_14865 [Pseudomonadota bacterium]
MIWWRFAVGCTVVFVVIVHVVLVTAALLLPPGLVLQAMFLLVVGLPTCAVAAGWLHGLSGVNPAGLSKPSFPRFLVHALLSAFVPLAGMITIVYLGIATPLEMALIALFLVGLATYAMGRLFLKPKHGSDDDDKAN